MRGFALILHVPEHLAIDLTRTENTQDAAPQPPGADLASLRVAAVEELRDVWNAVETLDLLTVLEHAPDPRRRDVRSEQALDLLRRAERLERFAGQMLVHR